MTQIKWQRCLDNIALALSYCDTIEERVASDELPSGAYSFAVGPNGVATKLRDMSLRIEANERCSQKQYDFVVSLLESLENWLNGDPALLD